MEALGLIGKKPQNYNLMGATFGNNTFVAAGYNGSFVRSKGTNWVTGTPQKSEQVRGFAF